MSKQYLAFVLAVCALPIAAEAQAPCTFTLFQVSGSSTLPNRIDRYGNVVGSFNNPNTTSSTGFIRAANGNITQYTAPNSTSTALADRNSKR